MKRIWRFGGSNCKSNHNEGMVTLHLSLSRRRHKEGKSDLKQWLCYSHLEGKMSDHKTVSIIIDVHIILFFLQFVVRTTHLGQTVRSVQGVWPIPAVGVVHVRYVHVCTYNKSHDTCMSYYR